MVCAINKIDSNITGLSYAEEECLKQLPEGTPAVAATGNIPLTGVPDDGDTITIGGVVYTFVASSPGANEILIGGTAALSATAAAAVITGHADWNAAAVGAQINITAATPGADGNAITLAASAETPSGATLSGGADAFGYAPWYGLEPNSYSDLGGELSTVARAPIDPSRQNKKGAIVDLEASGGFNTDFTKSNLTRLLQGFFFADARELPTTEPLNGSKITISSISGTNTYNVASGGTSYPAGTLIFAEGFSNAANNGLKRVTSSTGTTIVVAETLVNEASPPTAAKLSTVGRQLASGDANITVSGRATLTTSALNFTTLSYLIPGAWIFIGGDSASLRFANNVGYARIRSVSANALLLDDTTWTPQAETGTGLTVQLFFGTIVRNEKTPSLIKRRSYNLERTLGDGENGPQAEYLEGAVPNEFTLNVPQADKLNADLSFVACDNTYRSGDVGDELKEGERISAPGQDAYNTSSDIYRIKMSVLDDATSSPTSLFGYVSEASISINNNITPNKAVGVLGAFDASAGNFEVGGSLTVYFTTVAAVKAVRANADVSLSMIGAAQNAGFLFDIPLLGLGGGRINVEKDQPITVPLEPAGAESYYGYTMLHQVFSYLPTVAMPD